MAQVTYGTPAAQRFVVGNFVLKTWVVNGASGSTLPTGMNGIFWIESQPFCQAGTASLITGLSFSAGTITITSSGTMVNEVVQVWAREG